MKREKKSPTEVAHFAGPANKLRELREYAARLGCQKVDESIPWRDAFPEFKENEAGATLAGYRQRQGLTQVQLSASTRIPQRHISEMENGRRVIGVVNAKRLAAVLDCDHRRLL